jgi:hypothetical protein
MTLLFRQNEWRRLSSLRFRPVLMAFRRLESHYRLMVSARFSGLFLAPGFSRWEQGSPSPRGIARFSAASRRASALPLSPPLLKRIEKPG